MSLLRTELIISVGSFCWARRAGLTVFFHEFGVGLDARQEQFLVDSSHFT